ncbi:usherin-like isoform X2 [Amphiura filiformis]|uniref:usherin-like isoform X2 n=1 Tax=Amphiura filiformis TaxID=82378 RepID=UPI003B2141D9
MERFKITLCMWTWMFCIQASFSVLKSATCGISQLTSSAWKLVLCRFALSERIEETTFEHVPSGQLAPTLTPLSNALGVASGIAAEWGPPQNENGIILGYELFRRRFHRETGDRSNPVLLANGTARRYTDLDQSLVPDATYEYMVTSMNSVGQAASAWALVRMLEAPPQDVPVPEISELAATTLTVNVLEPVQPNGAVSSHTIIRNGTEIVTIPGTSYKDRDLMPFTYYSYAIKYCTSGGCTTSETMTIQTKQDTPVGLLAPVVREIDVTWGHVTWEYPTDSNGIISRFELHMRQSCPPPTQPFPQSCTEKSFRILYDGLQLSHNATGLLPYAKYDFKVKASNEEGQVESPVTQQDTLPTIPEYVAESKPIIRDNVTAGVYIIDWANSFRLYGELIEYQLVENGDKVYSGIATVVERRLDVGKYELMVTCRTKSGQVNYPTIIYEPSTGGGRVLPVEPLTQWYTSVWFIAIVVLVGVILIFIIIAVFFSRISKKQPYERERQPLPPRQRKGQFAFSGCKYPETESILDPIPNQISRSGSMHSLGQNAFANPSFLNVPSSRPPSRSIESPDKQSLKYIEDGDGFVEKSFVQLPKGDSGMYDDDALTQASIPYSYTKEQTMFTDTHL